MKTKSWHHYLVYKKQVTKTTWKLRLAGVLTVALLATITSTHWLPWIGNSLICQGEVLPSELIIVENLDATYLVFERASQLLGDGYGQGLMVPVQVGGDGADPNLVSRRFVEVMCEVAGIDAPEIFAVNIDEPISLNVALQVRERLNGRSVQSVIVVTPLFRSRRTSLVYREVLQPLGVEVYCVPTRQERNAENWWKTLHGVQQVVLEFLKLQYYRFLVF